MDSPGADPRRAEEGPTGDARTAGAPVAAAQAADDERARRYHAIQLALGLARLVLSAGFLVAALATGAAHAMAGAVEGALGGWPIQIALCALALGAAQALLSLPLGFVSGFLLPRRYGLLHQPLLSWLADQAKGAALGGAFALLALEIVYGLLRAFPAWWWVAAGATFLVLSIAITMVVPVWILPLFFRLTPLGDESLRARLLSLADRVGVPAIGVWLTDQSRKSRTANAAVVGLGRTRRIVLYDTLASGFTPDEIESVLAHELGHHVHGDVRRGLAVQALLTLATLAAADWLLRAGVAWWGLRGVTDPAGLPWLALVLLGLGLGAGVLGNAFSRRIERQADDFALATTGNADAFVGAMERLASLNLAERRPHRLKEIALYSHPALDRRIARARRFGASAPAAGAR
jgi:STE24 endopeptidase